MVGLAMLFVIVGCTQETAVVAPQQKITNFDECVAAGNPVMESFPEQCRANNQTFVNDKAVPPVLEENASAPSEKMRVMPSNEPLPPAVEAAKAFVEKEANSSAIVLSVNKVDWSDSCLGIVDPAASCLAAITPGYNLTIYAGESEYEIHTTEDGSHVVKAGVRVTGPLAI